MTTDTLPARIHLPPPFTLHPAGTGSAFDTACRLAPDEGAGALVVQQEPGRLHFAVVLEPDRPLPEARGAFFVGMAALADALAAHCPPERAVRIDWPDAIRYDRARLGGGRLAIAPGAGPGDVADWMVFCAELIADRDHVEEPGTFPDSTSLKEEGFDTSEDIVSTFASYLMLYFDRWTHQGIDAVTNRYLMRIDPPLLRGVRRIEGETLVEVSGAGATRRVTLEDGLAASRWRGPEGPVL
ncbi:MAG: biotin/lipoate--protein ligase family protein [Gemmobacter sp.]